MARNDLTVKINIERLFDGEPVDLEYIRQAIKEKRKHDMQAATLAIGRDERTINTADAAEMFVLS